MSYSTNFRNLFRALVGLGDLVEVKYRALLKPMGPALTKVGEHAFCLLRPPDVGGGTSLFVISLGWSPLAGIILGEDWVEAFRRHHAMRDPSPWSVRSGGVVRRRSGRLSKTAREILGVDEWAQALFLLASKVRSFPPLEELNGLQNRTLRAYLSGRGLQRVAESLGIGLGALGKRLESVLITLDLESLCEVVIMGLRRAGTLKSLEEILGPGDWPEAA
jgi:hypothetical protein